MNTGRTLLRRAWPGRDTNGRRAPGKHDTGKDQGHADQMMPARTFVEEQDREQRAEQRHEVDEELRRYGTDAIDGMVVEHGGQPASGTQRSSRSRRSPAMKSTATTACALNARSRTKKVSWRSPKAVIPVTIHVPARSAAAGR